MTHRSWPKREQVKRSKVKRVLPPWKLRKRLTKQLQLECMNVWQHIVKKRAGNKCEQTGITQDLQAHHVFHKANFPILRYNTKNGVCLSKGKHFTAHNSGEASLIAFLINNRGEKWLNDLFLLRITGEREHFQWTIPLLEEQKQKLLQELQELN